MFGKIVVGIDGQDGGLDALALARALAGPGTAIVAVHAFPCDLRPKGDPVPEYEELMRQDALAFLREAAGDDDAVELRPVGDVSPARGLHTEAEREAADLLVVGSCRHGPVGRLLLGDVARSALHGAPCPVAVAPRGYRTDPQEIRVVGVGYDDTESSRAALDLAAQIARDARGELRIVTAIPAPVAFAPADAYTYDWSHLEDERTAMRAQLGAIVEGLDVAASAEVVDGLAGRELETLSEEVDALVTGSRGWGTAKRVVLGSTTERLLRHAASPLIVTPGAERDADP